MGVGTVSTHLHVTRVELEALLERQEVGLLTAFAARVLALVLRPLVFCRGLLITLVPLGTGVGAASSVLYGHHVMFVGVGVLFLRSNGVAWRRTRAGDPQDVAESVREGGAPVDA